MGSSLFTILKKWTEKKDLRIFRTFFYTFKNEFIKSNVSGLVIECLALIFLVNLYTLFQQTNTYSVVFLIGNGTMIIMLMLLLMFFFPIYVRYQRYKVIVNKAFLITLRELPFTILILILCIGWGRFLIRFPGLIFFFSISLPALIITLIFDNNLAGKIYFLKQPN